MKILIDTNVILDVLETRQPHFECSRKAYNFALQKNIGYISVAQTRDIAYFLAKITKSEQKAKDVVKDLVSSFNLLDILVIDAKNALDSKITDYEDALLAFCAARSGINYIITRNIRDFENSPVPAVSPKDFLEVILCST
jgi:predicted nucleic acid-binding protein